MHGCPYKAFDADSVTAALNRLRITPQKVHDAVGKMQGGHYQLACAAAWEGAHSCECVTGINHPNQVWAMIAEEENSRVCMPLPANSCLAPTLAHVCCLHVIKMERITLRSLLSIPSLKMTSEYIG